MARRRLTGILSVRGGRLLLWVLVVQAAIIAAALTDLRYLIFTNAVSGDGPATAWSVFVYSALILAVTWAAALVIHSQNRQPPTPNGPANPTKDIEERIGRTLQNGTILTAFQPIHELKTGTITGVEALARFPSDDGRSPEHWFNEAANVGLGDDLELAAVESALRKAGSLPPHLSIALNISPQACLDPRLPALLDHAGVAVDRIILELTERLAVEDYTPLNEALEPLRRRGLQVAVDDAGSGFASMRHILQLRPDIIKLDRTLISGIDTDHRRLALGAAMVAFATETGARIIAEGIETPLELAAVSQLGMTSGQGYFLSRPTLHPSDWAAWTGCVWESDRL